MKLKSILMIAYTNYKTDPRVIREAEAAYEAGFKVDFLALKRLGENNIEIVRGVRVIRVKQNRYRGTSKFKYFLSYIEFFVRCFFKIIVLHIRNKYEIIHVNNMPDFIVFSTLIPKLFGSKIILDIHDPMPIIFLTKYEFKKGFFYSMLLFQERISCKYSNMVLTVHEPCKADILIPDGIPANKIKVICNFADEKHFRFNNNYKIDDKIKFVFHGTIAKRFGFDFVLQAIKNLKAKDKIFFKIIGEGDYSKRLKEIIIQQELENVVEFDNTFYPIDELNNKLLNFHAGVVFYELSPATDYMLPLKMLEYVSLGLPVITLKNRTICYYFEEDDCFYYNPNDIGSLENIFLTMINNPDILLAKHKKMKSLKEKFSWEKEKNKYINLIDKIISE